jgi:ATP-independent RNA helicase DbpA
VPTRELADQVTKELRRLARFADNIKIVTLCGGMPMGPQLGALEHGVHVVVGTPGRVLKHLQKETLLLDKLNTLVLDEADRMLDMGFHDSIVEVVNFVPPKRQTLLFSATYSDEIRKLSRSFQKNPVEVTVESVHAETQIEQHFFEIERGQRAQAVWRCCTIIYIRQQSRNLRCCFAIQKLNVTRLPAICVSRVFMRWLCMAIWSSVNAIRCWCNFPTAVARYWWQRMLQRVGWISRILLR